MSAFPRLREPRNTSVTTLFWEEMEDEHQENMIQECRSTLENAQTQSENRARTLFSKSCTNSAPIDVDDLFNEDCFFEPLHRREKSLTPTRPIHKHSK